MGQGSRCMIGSTKRPCWKHSCAILSKCCGCPMVHGEVECLAHGREEASKGRGSHVSSFFWVVKVPRQKMVFGVFLVKSHGISSFCCHPLLFGFIRRS